MLAALLFFLGSLAAHPASAQEGEEAGASRGGYAWGESGGGDEGRASGGPRLRYGDVFVSLGLGGSVRIVAYADVCNPDDPTTPGCRFSPLYLQLRGAYFFEGEGDVQHGAGLGIATNLGEDGTVERGVGYLAQWAFAPSYFLRWWAFEEMVQVMGHFGVPLSVAGNTVDRGRGMTEQFTYFNWGLELGIGAIVKFLHGLGVYAEVSMSVYFGSADYVWPLVSIEGGFVFDYEVLP